MARATKRTQANADEIVQTIVEGGTRKIACALVGMSTDTLSRWEDADAVFAERLREAEGKRDRLLVGVIRAGAFMDWKAAAWLLERVNRADYGTKTEITGKDGGPIKVDQTTRDLSVFTTQEVDALAAIGERVKGGADDGR